MKLRNMTKFKVVFGAFMMPSHRLPSYVDVAKSYEYIIATNKQNAIKLTIKTNLMEIWYAAPTKKEYDVCKKFR